MKYGPIHNTETCLAIRNNEIPTWAAAHVNLRRVGLMKSNIQDQDCELHGCVHTKFWKVNHSERKQSGVVWGQDWKGTPSTKGLTEAF